MRTIDSLAPAVAVAATIGLVTPASAATSIYTSPEKTIVYFVGNIAPGDDATFRNAVSNVTTTVVFADNPGGYITAALNIGEIIRSKGLETIAARLCASACALAWLAGSSKSVFPDTRVGFHAAYNMQTKQELGATNALIGAYLTKLGYSYAAVKFFTEAPPNGMQWLTPATARQYGIEVNIYKSPPQ